MRHIKIFPVFIPQFFFLKSFFKIRQQLCTEFFIKEYMTFHHPCILATNLNPYDFPCIISLDTPLFCSTICIFRSIKCIFTFFHKYIFCEIIVCRTDPGIFQIFSRNIQSRKIIHLFVIWIFNKNHMIFFFQIFKLFFQISDYDNNFINSCFSQLSDLTFNHNFVFHIQKRLRRLQ